MVWGVLLQPQESAGGAATSSSQLQVKVSQALPEGVGGETEGQEQEERYFERNFWLLYHFLNLNHPINFFPSYNLLLLSF